uniref:NADH-ubiquinone oxidoreductase chain 2 n=1 Tax=Cerambycidae sp. 8 KM-2017 TaxID=2219293 RepID=A0A346RGM3_9CUCU|nr:NADH dehydrogenase subunit 2 [Cerambycidae sp. 8 KM-2017]
MFQFYKILFFLSLIIGSLIAVSSYSWLSMWMGLEINLLSIIPLLKDSKNIYPSEAAFKYFITQALASSILLFSIILKFNISEFFFNNQFSLIFNSALFIKMGAAPFHSWFPEVAEGLNWMNNFILMTWQKLAPMIILFSNQFFSWFFISVIIFSSLIGGIMGLNQVSLRKILAYSSINHIAWMLSSMLYNQTIWLFYFLIYTLISLSIILLFNQFKMYYFPQLFQWGNQNKSLKFSLMVNFLSLGGLPPFLGFLPKWLVINSLVNNNFYSLSFFLIVLTLIPLFFYLRLIFPSLMINTNETLTFKSSPKKIFLMLSNFVSIFGLLICTLIFNYI